MKKYYEDDKWLAAICAAPSFLAYLDILKNKTAVCYPSVESKMINVNIGSNIVEVDGKIITSKGPATSLHFALKIVEVLEGSGMATKVKQALLLEVI